MTKIIFLSMLLILFSCSNQDRSPSSIDSVLYIGDSQSEGFLGEMVYRHLRDISIINKIELFGVGSSSPRHWADDKNSKHSKWLCQRKGRFNNQGKVSIGEKACQGGQESSAFSFLNRTNPNIVIFQFLGNSMGFNEAFISKRIKKMLSNLSEEQECLFITSPPYFKDLVEKNQLRLKTERFFIKAIGSRCQILRGMTDENLEIYSSQREYYLNDRIHLSQKGAKAFFEQIRPHLP